MKKLFLTLILSFVCLLGTVGCNHADAAPQSDVTQQSTRQNSDEDANCPDGNCPDEDKNCPDGNCPDEDKNCPDGNCPAEKDRAPRLPARPLPPRRADRIRPPFPIRPVPPVHDPTL